MFQLEIPKLVLVTLELLPEDESLGLKVRNGVDDIPEVGVISPGGPASRVPLTVGSQILTVEGHRVKNAKKLAELLRHFKERKSSVRILVSVGPLPPGAKHVMVKTDKGNRVQNTLDDGSLQGLFFDEESESSGKVRVNKIGSNGIFAGTQIKKNDTILAINGLRTKTVEDCGHALENAVEDDVVVVTTYNVFRKVKTAFCVTTGSLKAQKNEQSSLKRMDAMYELGTELGSGAFGTVVLCTARKTGKKFAMKIVNRDSLSEYLEEALGLEVSILNELDHPNIMRLESAFTTTKSYYLVTELLEGGELFDRIIEKSVYNENEARELGRTLFGAIQYCHEKHVCHRDLKPENILLSSTDNDCEVKIVDFGCARKATRDDSLKTHIGSHYYISPEILKGHHYGTKTDIWALGVILFILLSGYPPFADEDQEVQKECIKNGSFQFDDDCWLSVSNEAKTLIVALLEVDPQDRLSASDALKHPWFKVDRKHLLERDLTYSKLAIEKNFIDGKFKSAVKKVMAVNVVQRTAFASSRGCAPGDNTQTKVPVNYLFRERCG